MRGNDDARASTSRIAWFALAICALSAGTYLRVRGLGRQIIIDDEWHALHKLMRADMLDIVTHLDYADYSIPLTIYFRWLYDTVGVTEWGMHLPMLLAGVALIAVGPLLVRPWTTAAVRAVWAVLLAVSPLLVYFSRTARPYALTTLLATLALVAFQRWFVSDRHRDRWGATYIAATVLGGYLHMTSLAFTLMPFVYFGARTLRGNAAELRRLVRMGVMTSVPLAIVLLPPVINDWFMFTAKAGVDSVTLVSSWRTLLMLTGSAHATLALVLGACGILGGVRVWRRDRVLAGYLFAVMAGGTLAIVAARPNWVMYPLVLARYLVSVLPLALLLVAEGLVALTTLRRAPVHAVVVAVIGAALWALGPLPAQSYEPNQFTGHLRFQFDYDDAHNPYVQQVPDVPVPAFYQQLAKSAPGTLTLIEAPWRLESHFNPHVWYQQVHRQNVKIGLATPLCGVRDFGEYPETRSGMQLAHMAHLSAVLHGERYGADYLVMHVKPWSTPPDAQVPWPDVAQCMPAIEAALGTPVFRDDRIVVFALRRDERTKPAGS